MAVLITSGLVCWQVGAVGTWFPLANLPPGAPGHMVLLSDGTVMVQNNGNTGWYRLTPNASGSYISGTWTTLKSMNYSREYYSSDVLRDGRLFVAGGEYGTGGANAEVYDPLANSWSVTSSAGVGFADSESVLLPNGNVLVSPVSWVPFPAFVTMIYNPNLNTWTNIGESRAYQDECSWVKLPDDSILTVDDNNTTTERYIPSLGQWIVDRSTPVNLWDPNNGEIGASLLLPDGRAFYLGASGHTAFYTPSGNTNFGSWAVGPNLPNGYVMADAPSAMMRNGKILFVCSTESSHSPFYFYEYDPVGNAFTQVSSPTGGLSDGRVISDATSMVDLPDGTVLFNDTGTQLYAYVPDGSTVASGKPSVSSVAWNTDGSLHLTGTLFNGISQGAMYGDDAQQDSNYPIVRFIAGGNVYYGRTYNWSRTSVQTGSAIVTTDVSVPSVVFSNPGNYSLIVVANGIPSDQVTFYGPVWVDFNYSGFQFGTFSFPYSTLAQGVSAVASGGTVAINAGAQPSDSHETMTISKPMTIISVYGPSTIGH